MLETLPTSVVYFKSTPLTSSHKDATGRAPDLVFQRPKAGESNNLSHVKRPQRVYPACGHPWLTGMPLNVHEDAVEAASRSQGKPMHTRTEYS